jgi:hypothetical protein
MDPFLFRIFNCNFENPNSKSVILSESFARVAVYPEG